MIVSCVFCRLRWGNIAVKYLFSLARRMWGRKVKWDLECNWPKVIFYFYLHFKMYISLIFCFFMCFFLALMFPNEGNAFTLKCPFRFQWVHNRAWPREACMMECGMYVQHMYVHTYAHTIRGCVCFWLRFPPWKSQERKWHFEIQVSGSQTWGGINSLNCNS